MINNPMQDIKQQLFNILETNYGHIEVNARKELEDLLSLAVEQEKDRIVELLEKELPINLKEVLDLINNK